MTAVLPTGGYINPTLLADSKKYSSEWVAYVLFKQNEQRTRPTRVLTSHGSLGWKLGDDQWLYHDQTGAALGHYKVVGITYADRAKGAPVGDVPDVRIKHCVAK
jgi:hypothetical protein